MLLRRSVLAFVHFSAAIFFTAAIASAQAPPPSGPADAAVFTKGLTPQTGLFTIWRKDGKVYLELQKAQLDTDFIQTIVPSSGLGGFGITPGLPYLQFPSARIVRFSRNDNNTVSVTWPNTSFIATEGTPAARAIRCCSLNTSGIAWLEPFAAATAIPTAGCTWSRSTPRSKTGCEPVSSTTIADCSSVCRLRRSRTSAS